MKQTKLIPLLLAGALMAACSPVEPQGPEHGEALFETCTPCHGERGEGIEEFAAPPIAGMPQWYLERQLGRFLVGERGAHPDDVNGLRMRPMARTLRVDRDDNGDGDGNAENMAEDLVPGLPSEHTGERVRAVASFVAAMPAPADRDAGDGNAEAGQALFASCADCHGDNAQGNEERGAPPLASLPAWYIVSELELIGSGVRVTNAGGVGEDMRGFAAALDEQGRKDVAAYITTLSGGQ